MCNSALHRVVMSSRPPPYSEVDPCRVTPDQVGRNHVGCRVVELDSGYNTEHDSDDEDKDEDEDEETNALPTHLTPAAAQSLARPYIILNSASIIIASALLWLHMNGYIDLSGRPANVLLAVLVFAACMQVAWMGVVTGMGKNMVDRERLVVLVAVTFVGYVGGIGCLL